MKWVVPFALLFAACVRQPPLAPKPLPADQRVALRDRVRHDAIPACGECHVKSSKDAKPAALAVFDLELPEWQAAMTDEQLHVFLKRGARQLDSTVARAFLEAELAHRHPGR